MELNLILEKLKDANEFEILGVPYTATEEELKKARKTLLRSYHPDRQRDEVEREAAHELSTLVNQAFQLIIEGKAQAPSLPENTLEIKGLTMAAVSGLTAQELIKGKEVTVIPFGLEGETEERTVVIPPLTVAGSCIVYEGLGGTMDGGNKGNLIVQCIVVGNKVTEEDRIALGSERIVMADYSSEVAIGDNELRLFNGKKFNAVKVNEDPHLLLIKDVATRGQQTKSALIMY